jgi:cytochrome b561
MSEMGALNSAADVWLHWITAGLIVLRVGAALKHQFIDRDGVFQRMWPTSHP